MSVEQTTQLIQLILNSVLMTIACALLLSRLGMRQTALEERLQVANRQCLDLLEAGTESRSDVTSSDRFTNRVLQAKKHLRQLQYRYRIVHYGMVANHYALLCAIASTLTLALRSLLDLEWLIPISLALFVFGVALLLMGVGLTLIDLHTADRSLWEEITSLLSLGKIIDQPKTERRQRTQIADRFMRDHASRMRPSPKARVS